MNSLMIDAGNSYFKIAVFNDNQQLINKFSIDNQSIFSKLQAQLPHSQYKQIWIACVNQQLDLSNLKEILQPYSSDIYLFKNEDYQPIQSDYQSLAQLGVDRWLGVLYPHCLKEDNYVVISCGTAITLDIVINNKHLGGNIIPGITTALESLQQKANLNASFKSPIKLNQPGTTTSHCIIQGVLSYTIAYLNKMISTIQKQHRSKLSIWICGGNAELIASYLNYDYNLEPDLVLKSLNQLANIS